MKNAFRAYRRNQPHHNEVEQTTTPFFDKTSDAPDSPFFSKGNGVVQTKLTVGQPGDVYEQEADAVADAVVQNQHKSAAPAIQQKGISRIQRELTAAGPGAGTAEERMKEDKLIQEKQEPGIQKMDNPLEEDEAMEAGAVQKMEMPKEEEDPLAAGAVQKMEMPKEEEDPLAAGAVQKMEMPKEEEYPLAAGAVQKMEMPKEEEDPLAAGAVQKMEMPKEEEKPGSAPAVMTKPNGTQTASPQVSHGIESSKGSGSALPDATRAEMESSIGYDFSRVNIHTGQEAADLNKDLHAQAFTHGQDVYFNEGKYSPETTEGKRLLAHELTHVVQQGEGDERINRNVIQLNGDANLPLPPFSDDKLRGLSKEQLETLYGKYRKIDPQEAEKIKRMQKTLGFRGSSVKRGSKKFLRKAGKLAKPAAALFFLSDWYSDGLGTASKNAANSLLWPISEIWD